MLRHDQADVVYQCRTKVAALTLCVGCGRVAVPTARRLLRVSPRHTFRNVNENAAGELVALCVFVAWIERLLYW